MTRFQIAFVAFAVALAAIGCNADSSPPSATVVEQRADMKPERTQSHRDTLVANATGPAGAQKPEAYVIIGAKDDPKAVNPEVKQGKGKAPTRVIRPARQEELAPAEEPTFTAAGGFETTKEKAKESAIRAAVEKLHDYLQEQSPPVTRHPTTEMVRRMLVRHPGASAADAEYGKVTEQVIEVSGKNETLYQAEVAVKVRPENVREVRARERSSEALWVLAGLGGLAAVLAVFFRIDAWTKGYLTSWLVLGTVGAAALLAGLWWFARAG